MRPTRSASTVRQLVVQVLLLLTTIGVVVHALSPASSQHASRRHVLETAALATTTSLLPGNIILGSSVAHAATTTSAKINPIATLSDGTTQFPLASFGLQIYNDDKAYKLTTLALKLGYRNFFASVLAGNQRGFAKAVKDSGVDRKELFICGSVVSNRAQGFRAAQDDTTAGWKRNMEAFAVGNIDYLDQIMLDYPGPDAASIHGQWASFQTMQQQGLTKTLSVSNFNGKQLDAILAPSNTNDNYQLSVKPLVNQLPYSVAYHPNQQTTLEQNAQRGLLVQAWAPLGGSLGGRFSSSIKGKCAEIGKKYNKSFAQVALRWIVQTGASFTTQSQNEDHFQQNLDIFEFELSPEDMAELSSLA